MKSARPIPIPMASRMGRSAITAITCGALVCAVRAGDVPKGPDPHMKHKPTNELTSDLLSSATDRQEAAKALALRGAAGAGSAITAMRSDDADVRIAGCEVIRLMPMCGFDGRGCGTARAENKNAVAAADQLSELLVDQNPAVRDRATQAIAAIGKASKESEVVLFERMQETDDNVCIQSTKAFAAIHAATGMDRARILPVALKLLKHPRGEVRWSAVHIVYQLGKDEQSVKALAELAMQPATGHWGGAPRTEAISSLRRWKAPETLTACEFMLNEDRQIDHEFFANAKSILKTLREMGAEAKSAVPAINRFIGRMTANRSAMDQQAPELIDDATKTIAVITSKP